MGCVQMSTSGSCIPQLLSPPQGNGEDKKIKKRCKICEFRYRQCNREINNNNKKKKTTTIKELEYRKQVMHNAIINNPPTDVQPVPEQRPSGIFLPTLYTEQGMIWYGISF